MDLLQWKPQYSVGIAEMDYEHRQMFRLINRLYARLGDPAAVTDVATMLADIHTAISAHFALEERIMRDARYPHYAAHKDDHEALLDQILEMMERAEGDPDQATAQLRQRLEAWFMVHFSSHDARLHGQLPSAG